MTQSLPPLVVVVGQTATGKSQLALGIAERFNGEIICADSRTVYKGLDIGTAKPTVEEQAVVRHHLLDVVGPNQSFTVADFKEQAVQAISDISSRGKLPILVGGTGLYIDAVLFNYQFQNKPDLQERQRLQRLSIPDLQAELLSRGLPLPHNHQNPRHLVRVLETGGVNTKKDSLRPHTLIIGLRLDRDELQKRIANRAEHMLEQGLLKETEDLSKRYGWDIPALQSTSYQALRPYFIGDQTLEQAKSEFIKNDLSLAKRQLTWFKRNKSIQWIHHPREAVELVTTLLSKISH